MILPVDRFMYTLRQLVRWWTFSSHIVEEDVGLPQANHGHPYVWPGVELDHLTQGGRISEGEHGGAGVGV